MLPLLAILATPCLEYLVVKVRQSQVTSLQKSSLNAEEYTRREREREIARLTKKATKLGFTLAPIPA
jgi:hypothetical protein